MHESVLKELKNILSEFSHIQKLMIKNKKTFKRIKWTVPDEIFESLNQIRGWYEEAAEEVESEIEYGE